MKKYILPTLTVIGVALGIVIGMTLSQKANAQRIVYQNGHWQLEQTKRQSAQPKELINPF